MEYNIHRTLGRTWLSRCRYIELADQIIWEKKRECFPVSLANKLKILARLWPSRPKWAKRQRNTDGQVTPPPTHTHTLFGLIYPPKTGAVASNATGIVVISNYIAKYKMIVCGILFFQSSRNGAVVFCFIRLASAGPPTRGGSCLFLVSLTGRGEVQRTLVMW